MKLLGSTRSKVTKNRNRGIFCYLEITEVDLVRCNMLSNDYQHD